MSNFNLIYLVIKNKTQKKIYVVCRKTHIKIKVFRYSKDLKNFVPETSNSQVFFNKKKIITVDERFFFLDRKKNTTKRRLISNFNLFHLIIQKKRGGEV